MVDAPKELGRNDPCHCGSGKKYKHCCLAKDEAVVREQRAKAAEQVAAATAEAPAAEKHVTKPKPPQPWKGRANTRGFTKRAFQRKAG
jgi:hypothetical protein